MNRIVSFLLRKYDSSDTELFLKAKFVLIGVLAFIILQAMILVYTSSLVGIRNSTVFFELTYLAIMGGALVMLVRGRYHAAIHTIIIFGFTLVWVVLFSEPKISLVAKIDTIVFIIVLLAALPLLFSRDKKPVVIYFIVNIILFSYFCHYLTRYEMLMKSELLDYFFDNATAMVFVFFISFNLVSIYQSALRSLKKELNQKENARKALRESENQLAIHLTNTPVGAISMDMDLNVTGWNPAAEKIFGYTREEAVKRRVTDLLVPEHVKEDVLGIFEALISQQGGENNTNENITKSGKLITCNWYNTAIHNVDGELTGFASLVNDITERKKAEELIVQSEKMMSIGGLAAGMAHEINNPLAGMMQNAQVVRNRLAEDLPANREIAVKMGISMEAIQGFMKKRGILDQLESINQAGGHAAKIIENMLSFARKGDSVKRDSCMEELIEKTIDLARSDYDLKKRFDFKKIEILREYDNPIPLIRGEASKIQQVLFNILKNASEAMSDKMERGETAKIIIRLKNSPDMVRVEIEDNGPGIPLDIRKRIFEPFFTTKSPDRGTGLGLSVSYFIIVDDHEGHMSVEPVQGGGTRFIIELPV